MWENEEMKNTGAESTERSTGTAGSTSNYISPQQNTGYGQNTGDPGTPRQGAYGSGTGSSYGQQNAWENPYANRYNDPRGNAHYTNAGSSYNGTPYGGYPTPPAGGGRKKGGIGKKLAVILAIAAVLALIVFGLYEVAQHIPLSGKTSQEETVAGIGEQAPEADTRTQELPPADQEEQELSGTQDKPATGKGDRSDRVTTLSAPSPVVVTDVTQVVAACMPAIVSIDNNFTETINYFGQRYTQEATGSGSGIIVGQNDEALLIATNYHVIENANTLSVQFVDGESAEAVVKDSDPDMDLAVIAVPLSGVKSSTMDSIVIATLGDSDALTLGEPAIAIGNAMGRGQSVTVGVVSALDREIQLTDKTTGTFIQTDAAINPGNSGGALLNSAGEVIGINSSKFADTEIEGMGFAIPISQAQPIIDEMMNRELVSDEDRGFLGISGATVPYEYTGIEGVRVRAVTKGSGADAAGIAEDDIIIRLNGETIKSMESLQNKLKYFRKGDKITLTILRRQSDRYAEVDVDVTLSDRQAAGIDNKDSNNQNDRQQGQQDDPQNPGQEPGQNPGGQQDGGQQGNGQDDYNYYYFGDGNGNEYSFPFNFPFFGSGNY